MFLCVLGALCVPDPVDLLQAGGHVSRARVLFGKTGEDLACRELERRGYAIVARRWRRRQGEIDIIARDGATLVFVEVKARERLDDAAEAILPRQQRRIIAAAEAWLARHPDDVNSNIRFDVVLVAPKSLPRHIMAAFDASN